LSFAHNVVMGLYNVMHIGLQDHLLHVSERFDLDRHLGFVC
jgi:hypothetical protein